MQKSNHTKADCSSPKKTNSQTACDTRDEKDTNDFDNDSGDDGEESIIYPMAMISEVTNDFIYLDNSNNFCEK